MSTKIILRELTLSCAIGTDAAERHMRQPLLLDADITLAAPPAGDAAPALDYRAAVIQLRELAAAAHCGLMETFAERAADLLLAEDAVRQVRLYVRKPRVFADLAAAGVEIVRGKEKA